MLMKNTTEQTAHLTGCRSGSGSFKFDSSSLLLQFDLFHSHLAFLLSQLSFVFLALSSGFSFFSLSGQPLISICQL